MVELHSLKPAAGARRKRTRVGRGNAASRGNSGGRGSKGQKMRGSIPPGFEGGQLPLIKKLPSMRGFTNNFRTEYQVVNIASLKDFEGEVSPALLIAKKLARKSKVPIKILGNGELKTKIKITAHKFSSAARAKIEKAGGECVELGATSASTPTRDK